MRASARADYHRAKVPGQTTTRRPSEPEFVSLCASCRDSGGIVGGDDLARLLEDRRIGDCANLGRCIASGEVFGFERRGCTWIPMFQFEPLDLSTRSVLVPVVWAFGRVLDGWALALWFTRPNDLLNKLRPVDVLDSNRFGVLNAARADRLNVTG